MLKLRSGSLDWALEHAINQGDTDIFPIPFEFSALKHDWDRVRSYLAQQDILEWTARPCRRCLAPKHRYGFRISTQLDPLDFLVYSALVYEIGADIEARRVPIASQHSFSYRFAPNSDGLLFDESIHYGRFQTRSRELLDKGRYSHVVAADIADFYPRLYSHRLQNALNQSTRRNNHVRAIMALLGQWNEHMSYGIPVGPAPSRLLAEVAIDDIDRALLSEGATYVRFSDDFRIFCTSSVEAHTRLAFLANMLFENHGLTLQQHKTRIFTSDFFRRTRFLSHEETEMERLSKRFYEIVEDLGLEDLYGYIDYDSLEPEQQASIDSLNLQELLVEQLNRDEVDIPMTRFVLRRLGQLDDSDAVDTVLGGIDLLYPVVPDVVRYLMKLRSLSRDDRRDIGARVLALLNDTVISHLEFHRMWLIALFSSSTDWDNTDGLIRLFTALSDQFSQREIVVALGRCSEDHWFRTRKRSVFDFAPWLRRAFLAGGSCLPGDEKKHWYQSLETRLDPLEHAVSVWARGKADTPSHE